MKTDSVLNIIDEHLLLPEQGFLQAAFEVFCLLENPGLTVQTDLILCLPEELKEINKRYRGVDQTTDVISFPHQAMPVNILRDLSCNSVSAGSVSAGFASCPKGNTDLQSVICGDLQSPTQSADISPNPDDKTVLAASACCSTIYLGEILIDINYIAQQTDSQDLNAEITMVFIHGLLHLCGYDHLNSNQKRNMQERERMILTRLRQEG